MRSRAMTMVMTNDYDGRPGRTKTEPRMTGLKGLILAGEHDSFNARNRSRVNGLRLPIVCVISADSAFSG